MHHSTPSRLYTTSTLTQSHALTQPNVELPQRRYRHSALQQIGLKLASPDFVCPISLHLPNVLSEVASTVFEDEKHTILTK